MPLRYCAAAGHKGLLSHLTTIWLHFALHPTVDAIGEKWLQTGCRSNVLQIFITQSGMSTQYFLTAFP